MCMQPSCNRLKAHSDNGFTYDIPSYNKNNAYMQLIIITTLDYLFICIFFMNAEAIIVVHKIIVGLRKE